MSLVLTLLAAAAAQTAGTTADLASIRQFEERQATAWNAHDIDSYADLFARDADVVNVLGWWWKSREELKAKLGAGFRSVFANSRLTIDEVAAERLGDALYLVHVRWSMTGAGSPDGSGNVPTRGIQTQVVRRTATGWEIAAFHNTNAVPERPFPVPPADRSR